MVIDKVHKGSIIYYSRGFIKVNSIRYNKLYYTTIYKDFTSQFDISKLRNANLSIITAVIAHLNNVSVGYPYVIIDETGINVSKIPNIYREYNNITSVEKKKAYMEKNMKNIFSFSYDCTKPNVIRLPKDFHDELKKFRFSFWKSNLYLNDFFEILDYIKDNSKNGFGEDKIYFDTNFISDSELRKIKINKLINSI